jgi:hypothetical protein
MEFLIADQQLLAVITDLCRSVFSPQLLVHLNLTKPQKKRAYEVVMRWAETDKSKIVGYYGFQAAADFAETDQVLLQDFIPRIRKANKTGAKSIQNRCKKIAKQLDIAL